MSGEVVAPGVVAVLFVVVVVVLLVAVVVVLLVAVERFVTY